MHNHHLQIGHFNGFQSEVLSSESGVSFIKSTETKFRRRAGARGKRSGLEQNASTWTNGLSFPVKYRVGKKEVPIEKLLSSFGHFSCDVTVDPTASPDDILLSVHEQINSIVKNEFGQRPEEGEPCIYYSLGKRGKLKAYTKLSYSILDEHLTFQMGKVMELQKTNPQVFNLLFPIIHHVVYSVGIPLWNENLLSVANMNLESERDNRNEDENGNEQESEYEKCLSESVDFYESDQPAIVAKLLGRKPKTSISLIEKRLKKITSRKVKEIVKLGLALVKSKQTLANFIPSEKENSDFEISNFLHLSWDFSTEVEENYSEYLDSTAYQTGLQMAEHLLPIQSISQMREIATGHEEFLFMLRAFMLCVNDYTRK
jgi:hypothetical protein